MKNTNKTLQLSLLPFAKQLPIYDLNYSNFKNIIINEFAYDQSHNILIFYMDNKTKNYILIQTVNLEAASYNINFKYSYINNKLTSIKNQLSKIEFKEEDKIIIIDLKYLLGIQSNSLILQNFIYSFLVRFQIKKDLGYNPVF